MIKNKQRFVNKITGAKLTARLDFSYNGIDVLVYILPEHTPGFWMDYADFKKNVQNVFEKIN